jgi:hypothetical protein
MQEHVHTGVISFLFAGISAVIFIQGCRLIAAKLVDSGHNGSGSSLGALVNFG